MRLGFIDDAALKSFPALLEAFDMQISLGAKIAVDDRRVKLLMTMPGLDYFSASLLIAEKMRFMAIILAFMF